MLPLRPVSARLYFLQPFQAPNRGIQGFEFLAQISQHFPEIHSLFENRTFLSESQRGSRHYSHPDKDRIGARPR